MRGGDGGVGGPGTPGGVLDVLGVLTDQGALVIQGGPYRPGGEGGRVEVSGTLSVTTAGTVKLQGGHYCGGGGLLTHTGLIDNEGVISLGAAQSVSLDSIAATLSVTAGNAGVLVASPAGGTVDVTGGGAATLNAADTNLSVFLLTAGSLTLSRMSAITAAGSSGADTITALSSGQTLTGGAGADLLTGATVTGDLFRNTALGLSGDTIANFAGTDLIDVTTIASGPGLALAYVQQGDDGLLSLSNGSATTTITLQGQFTPASFTTGSDGHEGVLIGLH